MDPQFFMEGNAYDDRFVFKELYELLNVSCIQVSTEMYSIHSKTWNGKYVEITEDTATPVSYTHLTLPTSDLL